MMKKSTKETITQSKTETTKIDNIQTVKPNDSSNMTLRNPLNQFNPKKNIATLRLSEQNQPLKKN